jgi:hypothetical protein
MIRTFVLAAAVFTATTAPVAMAQTVEPPAAVAAAQPLTPDKVKAIKRRLQGIEHDMAQEYQRYMNNRGAAASSTGTLQMERLVDSSRPEPRLGRNVRPLTPYLEELLRERATLEAKLAASHKP